MRLQRYQGSWLIPFALLILRSGQPQLVSAEEEDQNVLLTAEAPTEAPHEEEQYDAEDQNVLLTAEAPTEAPHEAGQYDAEEVLMAAEAPTEAPHEAEDQVVEVALPEDATPPDSQTEDIPVEHKELPDSTLSEASVSQQTEIEEEDESGPPSPAPTPPGTPIDHFANSTKDVWRVPRRLHSVEPSQHPKTKEARKVAGVMALQSAGIEFTTGAWAYGDFSIYVSDEGPVECAHRCEREPRCHHWNYYCKNAHCEFKTEQGFYEDGDGQFGRDYILTGESSRMRRLRSEKGSPVIDRPTSAGDREL